MPLGRIIENRAAESFHCRQIFLWALHTRASFQATIFSAHGRPWDLPVDFPFEHCSSELNASPPIRQLDTIFQSCPSLFFLAIRIEDPKPMNVGGRSADVSPITRLSEMNMLTRGQLQVAPESRRMRRPSTMIAFPEGDQLGAPMPGETSIALTSRSSPPTTKISRSSLGSPPFATCSAPTRAIRFPSGEKPTHLAENLPSWRFWTRFRSSSQTFEQSGRYERPRG